MLQLPDHLLDAGLVDPDDMVVFAGVDPERLAHRRQEMLLVHLRVSLHGRMDDVLGDLAELCDGLRLQFLIAHRHVGPPRAGILTQNNPEQ
jgi:hypothetical protein